MDRYIIFHFTHVSIYGIIWKQNCTHMSINTSTQKINKYHINISNNIQDINDILQNVLMAHHTIFNSAEKSSIYMKIFKTSENLHKSPDVGCIGLASSLE